MTNAEKLEKVVRGLECCIVRDPDAKSNCVECPYNHEGIITNAPCANGLMADALVLLEEQEPRVMTLDETIASCENPVWLEEDTLQGSYGAWGVVKGVHKKYNAVNIGGVRFGYWPRAKYNISWRCWTARPTEEQMREMKWEEGKDEKPV